MAKLNFSLDGKSLGEFMLDKERTTIGRRPASDIHIDNLAVSGEHAVIVTLGPDSFLEDLNSTNGTMVNKKMMKKHVLQHNDVIEFGKYQLQYVAEAQIKAAADGDQDSVADVSQSINHPQAEDAVNGQQATVAVGVARLQVLNGDNAGQEVLLNRAMVKLGTPGDQLAVVTKRPNGYYISHVEGVGRPLINQQPIGLVASELQANDVIELAGTKMKFLFV
jgi:pSer/pThr/pTyr-binding forkhead associated (FHA) protein